MHEKNCIFAGSQNLFLRFDPKKVSHSKQWLRVMTTRLTTVVIHLMTAAKKIIKWGQLCDYTLYDHRKLRILPVIKNVVP